MTRVADTSLLYALFDADDAHHQTAREAVSSPEPIEIPREVLTETIDLVAYRAGWSAAQAALAWLVDRPHVHVADTVPLAGVQAVYEDAQGALSLTDAVVVQTCRALGAQALAEDTEILSRAP